MRASDVVRTCRPQSFRVEDAQAVMHAKRRAIGLEQPSIAGVAAIERFFALNPIPERPEFQIHDLVDETDLAIKASIRPRKRRAAVVAAPWVPDLPGPWACGMVIGSILQDADDLEDWRWPTDHADFGVLHSSLFGYYVSIGSSQDFRRA